MLEEELVCEKCNGVGTIIDDTGRMDVCSKCFGLGYIKEIYRRPPLTETKLKLKRALVFTFIGLTIYYVAFSYSYIRYTLTPIDTLIILMVGHLTAVSFLVFYILFRAVKESK